MTIDANGLQPDSFSTIYDNLANQFKAIYGIDINLAQDTADGQQLGIYSNVVYDLQTAIARLYNSFDPDLAEGHELDKILKLLATTRRPSTKSTVDIDVTVDTNVVIPAGYTIKDVNNQDWQTIQSHTLAVGANTVTFESVAWGAVEAQPSTINKFVSVLTEVVSVNNPSKAIVGQNEETDIQLRKRRNKLIGYNAQSLISSMLGKLLKLSNVLDVVIYENDTDVQDTVKNIAPHTIWIVVDGGAVADIAKVIATDKAVGCGLKGTISETYIETFTRADGSTRTHYHPIKFDRPVQKDIFIKFDVKKRVVTDIIDQTAIIDELIKLKFNIAQNITATELYSNIYAGGSNFIASNLQLSVDGSTWVTDLLSAGYADKFNIISSNIAITEI